jgi:hypothetical protein
VQVELIKEDADRNITARSQPHFRSLTYSTLNVDTFSEHELNEAFHKISKSLEAYLRDSLGWIINKVIYLKIHTVTYKPISGSTYIPLPTSLKHSNCIPNVENSDAKCFLYSVLASLHPVESQPELVCHYLKHENELNMKGITYPVSLNQIDKFESQNGNISINLFTFEQNEILPLKITKQHDRLYHINFLLLQNQIRLHLRKMLCHRMVQIS